MILAFAPIVVMVSALWDIEPGQAVPSIGAASLLVVVLRMVYKDNGDRRKIETELREEFRQAREQMIAEHKAAREEMVAEHRKDLAEHKAERERRRIAHQEETDDLRKQLERQDRRIESLEGQVRHLEAELGKRHS